MRFLATAAIVAIAACIASDAQAYNKNISGVWKDAQGDQWVVAQVSNSCSFSTSVRPEATGLISLNFSGFISDNGGDEDFTFSGTMEPKDIRVKGVRCRLTGNMSAAGDVAGEYGGRVIHMDSCNLTLTITCTGGKTDTFTAGCSGTWT